MNVYTRQKHTHRHGKQTWLPKGKIRREFGIKTYTLLYIKYTTDKDLQHSTENYTQYFVVTSKGKESEKKCICVCVCLIDVCVCLIDVCVCLVDMCVCLIEVCVFNRCVCVSV